MRASRRATVTASGVAVLGLAGCTDGSGSTPSPSPSASPTTATDVDPDRLALDRAVAITTGLLAVVSARPGLDPEGRFLVMHREHLTVLNAAAAPSESASAAPAPPVTPGPRAFRRQEVSAQRELAHLASEAASGPLARLLACMSAGIAAHLSATT